MRKIVTLMHISLDGFAAGPNGEMNWIKLDNEMFDFVKLITDKADSALYGRVTWQMMDSYWPTAGNQINATKHDKEHSEWYNKVEKIVISKSLQGQDADKTIFLGGDIISSVKKIKQVSGKDILIFGSPSVLRLLMLNNLIDDYWLFINPIILGQGLSIFSKQIKSIDLKFKWAKTFPCGVTALTYTIGEN